MEIRYTTKEKIAGFFVILTAILLLSTVILIGRGKDWFRKYVSYYTMFEESYNIAEDTAVKLFKTDIGKVKSISIQEDRVRVELIILQDFAPRIRVGTVATVESPTLIGSEYVSIKPGRKSAPLIPRDGLIPSSAKRSLTDLMDEFQVEKTAKMFVQAVQDVSELAHQIRDPGGPLFRILDNLEKTSAHIEAVSGGVRDGKGTAGALLTSDILLVRIRENLDQIGKILDHVTRATAGLPKEMDQVGRILDRIDQTAAKAPGAMDQVQDGLATFKQTGDGLNESIAQIRDILTAFEKNMKALDVIMNNVQEASFDVPKITQSTREGIKDIKGGVDDMNRIVKSLQKNILIRSNLPPDPIGKTTDAGLRE